MITNQTSLFLIFIINGFIIGLLFDIFRILRKTIKTSDFFTYIEDFIFWILTGSILLYSIFTFNNGEIRLFMFLAALIGVILYIMLISSYFIKVNVTIINFIKKIFIKIFSLLVIPFIKIFNFIKKTFFKPISFMIINIRKNFKNFYLNIKKMKKKQKTLKKSTKIRLFKKIVKN